jgi:hypothetical protein
MKKSIFLLLIPLLFHTHCSDVEDDFFDISGAQRAPFITFDQIPDFNVDIFDPQTAAFETILNDTGNATQQFSIHLHHTNDEGEEISVENFIVIDQFPYELNIRLEDVAQALELDLSGIEANTVFEFTSTATGKDGTVYSGNVWDYEEDNLVYEENEEEEIIRIHDPGTAMQGGNLDSTLEEDEGFKSAMSFRLVTIIPPPPIYRFTSFETVPVPATNDKYCKKGDADEDEDLTNNEGEPYVDFIATGTGPEDEIGFDSEFINNGDSGFTCEQLGVLGFDVDDSNHNGWSHGNQGYYAEDIDGILKITFDRVEIPAEHPETGIRIDAFLRDTSYEDDDYLHIYVEVEKTDGFTETLDLVNADDVMMKALSEAVLWHTFDSGLMNGVSAYTLVVEYSCNSGSERLYLDYLLVYLPRE